MAIPVNTLMEESKCYLCLGITQAEALELALLNRIASGGYQEYVAIVNQTGVVAPVSTILKNTLPGTPVWSYFGAGEYDFTLANAFPLDKTVFIFGPSNSGEDVFLVSHTKDSIHILVGPGDDNALINWSIIIRVYP